ncbi:MAG: restriction endonuclease subunit S [Rhodospirillales bacterium]
MISSLKPYPVMKVSGVPWLGAVPEHWEIERLKNRASNIVEQTASAESDDLYVALEHVESWTGRIRSTNTDTAFESHVKKFKVNDVLFGKLRPYLAKVARPERRGVCVGEFFVLRTQSYKLQSAFLEHLLRAKPIIDIVDASTFGAKMPRADWQFVGNMALAYPSSTEQSAIVRFLDHADRKIRRYIRARQKLIKLLEEQKQAIIQQAVTRGLDPNVRLKPSGVEWLDDVPKHWELRKLGSMGRVFNGTTPSRNQSRYWNNGTIPWLSSGKVNDGVVESASEFITEVAFRETSVDLVPRGSVILGLVGQGKTRGMCALLNIDACINQNLAAIVPGKPVEGRYLRYMLTGFYKTVREAGRGGNQAALNCEIVSLLRLPLPPLGEQRAITGHLDRELAVTDEAQVKARREIALLNEYRTRLVADVVTGKLDVREVAVSLPAEDEQGEATGELEEITEEETTEDNVLETEALAV